MGSRPLPADVTRRRFQRRQWRRRWLAWKPVAALLALVLLAVGGVWAVYFSSLLDVEGVEVSGTEVVSADEVRRAAAVPAGQSLARVDLAAIRTRVAGIAAVRSVQVTRQWPDQVLVEVSEREPVAVVDIGGVVRGMDETGTLFRDYRTPPPGLPQVSAATGVDTEALRQSAAVVTALPTDLVALVERVEVATADDIRLRLRDGRLVVWGSSAESEQKARVLPVLLTRKGKVYDVSVPGRPTTSATEPSA